MKRQSQQQQQQRTQPKQENNTKKLISIPALMSRKKLRKTVMFSFFFLFFSVSVVTPPLTKLGVISSLLAESSLHSLLSKFLDFLVAALSCGTSRMHLAVARSVCVLCVANRGRRRPKSKSSRAARVDASK